MERLGDLTERMRRIEAHSDDLKKLWCLARYPGDLGAAVREAERNFRIKATVPAGDTTSSGWGSELVYPKFRGELVSVLNAGSLLSLPWRKADFNTRTLCESTPGAAGWVSEGSAIPGSKLNLATVTLERGTKIAGLVFLSNEVLELWTSATSSQLNRALVNVVGRYVDVALLDPNLGAVAGLRPASLTNGATRISSPAATEAGVTTAVKAALQVLADGGGDLRNAVLVMSPSTALSVSTLLTAGNIRAFPNVGVRGGEVFGVPVVTTTGAASQGSPTENLVVAIDPSQVLLADSGDVEFSTSRQAALQMDNAPGAGAQSSVSLYQTGTTAIKFVRQLNFEKCHSSATSFFTTTF